MNPVFFSIGSFEVRYYGLSYAISFFIATEFLKREGIKRGYSKEFIDNYSLVAILSGLLGGRLYYVLFNLSYYISNPFDILAVWKGGMAIHGGIIGGFIGTIVYCKMNKKNPFEIGDMVAPFLILGQAIGRLGNLANGEVHGVPTFTPFSIIFSLKPRFYTWFNEYKLMDMADKIKYKELVPWGLVFPETSSAGAEFPNYSLHPAMLYESILNLIGFIFLYYLLRKRKYPIGIVWWLYIIIYSLNRIFISFFRAEDLMFHGYRAPHIISIVLIIISILAICYINKKNIRRDWKK